MARKRIIEGTWNCSSCGAQGILARFKTCPTCGNPREQSGSESKFDFGAASAKGGLTRESVTDATALGLAGAGADWFCAYCGASNRGDHPQCRTCGATRAVVTASLAPAAQLPARKSRAGVIGLVLLVLLSAGGGFAFWATRTHDVEATVTAVSWIHTVDRQRFTPVERRGWRDQLSERATAMPLAGRGEIVGIEQIRDCVSKQRGTRQVADGVERVCRTETRSVACGSHESCSTRDLGNGYAEVCDDVTDYCDEPYEDCRDETRYRTEPVFAQECGYDTWEWQPLEQRTSRGSTEAPSWPELPVDKLDRLVRNARYDATIEYQRKGVTRSVIFHPGDEAELARFKPGNKVTLVVANSGKVQGLREGEAILDVDE